MERADYLNTYQESYFEDHLEKDSNLNVFGWASTNPIYGGTGSGSSDSSNAVDILTSLKDAGKMSNMTKLFLEIDITSGIVLVAVMATVLVRFFKKRKKNVAEEE